MTRRATVLMWTGVVFSMVAVVVFSLALDPFPDLGSGILPSIVERLPHILAYAVLTGLTLVAWKPRGEERSWFKVTIVALGILAIGVALEVGQAAVDRDTDPVDVLANAAGVGMALGLWAATSPRGRDRVGPSDRSVPTSRERGVRTGNGPSHRDDPVVE